MELITNKLDDLRILHLHYGDLTVQAFIDKHSEAVFIDRGALPTVLQSCPDNSDPESWRNLKIGIARTITNTINQ